MSHTSECTLHAYLFKILFSKNIHILRHTYCWRLGLSTQSVCPSVTPGQWTPDACPFFTLYCVRALATSSTSLSSFHPPVPPAARLTSLPAYPLTQHTPAAGCCFIFTLQPGTVQKGDILFGSTHPTHVWSLWPSAGVNVWPGVVGKPVFSQSVMFSTWGGSTLKAEGTCRVCKTKEHYGWRGCLISRSRMKYSIILPTGQDDDFN